MKTLIHQKLKLFNTLGMKKILVACSGGADSMALLNLCRSYALLNEIGLRVIHINHNIQEANDGWEGQVKKWCEKLEIEFNSVKINLEGKNNIEEKARVGRQGAIKSLIGDGEWVLTAHHANDQAENIIMALARSGGHNALSGMSEINEINGYISAKPMLGVSKDDVYKYCELNKIEFVNDPTNFESIQDRNFVRNKVIPLLQSRWPNIINSINKSAKNIAGVSKIISDSVDGYETVIEIKDLKSMSCSSEEILRTWIKKRFKKSVGNNIINQISTFAKSDTGQTLDMKGINIGVWKNNIYDLSIDNNQHQGYQRGLKVKYSGDMKTVMINGTNKKIKKVFKELNVPPWERENTPFYFKNEVLVSVGNRKVN